jgi:hydrogenase small subunit
VGTGHPCIGCTEKGIGFAKPIHALAELQNQRPPLGYPRVVEEQGTGATLASSAVLVGVAAAAAGAGFKLVGNLGKTEEGTDPGKDKQG